MKRGWWQAIEPDGPRIGPMNVFDVRKDRKTYEFEL